MACSLAVEIYCASYAAAVIAFKNHSLALAQAAMALWNPEKASVSELAMLYPDPGFVRREMIALCTLRDGPHTETVTHPG